MSTSTDDNSISTCANCCKGEDNSDSLKACTACDLVRYCNADCEKAHRPQHEKECKERAAEIRDELLFKPPPQADDCPICFLRLPLLHTGYMNEVLSPRIYVSCCGKIICSGCVLAPVYDELGNKVDEKCPFCRIPVPTSEEEYIKRMKKRVELGDTNAICNLGGYHCYGEYGCPVDYNKSLALFLQAGELGHAPAFLSIGNAYGTGRGVKKDMAKARHYYELAAVGGDGQARHNLGVLEDNAGNVDRALKHYMIAVGAGFEKSLEHIKQLFMDGDATKDDYGKALRSYQAYLDEIKSDKRDKAASSDNRYRYTYWG